MKIVFLHGRDQQGKNPVHLEKEWVDTFGIGLQKNGLTLPPGVKICFPFYGDMLQELVEQSERSIDVIAKGGTGNDKEAQFYYEFLTELAQNAGITDQEIMQQGQVTVVEKGPLNWKWVRGILQALDSTRLADMSIAKFTHDVWLYLSVPGIRKTINDYVKKEVGNEPCVFVSHSLGTIVAYYTLFDLPMPAIRKFITIGSPLGLDAVRNRLPPPLKLPIGVDKTRGWFNAYDPRDVVSLFPLDKRRFDIDPAIVNKGNVRNHTSNNHGIVGYLNDMEIAKQIYDAL